MLVVNENKGLQNAKGNQIRRPWLTKMRTIAHANMQVPHRTIHAAIVNEFVHRNSRLIAVFIVKECSELGISWVIGWKLGPTRLFGGCNELARGRGKMLCRCRQVPKLGRQ